MIEIHGPDVQDFLHRISTVDVKRMQMGDTELGFFLNAQGRIRAVFYLIYLAEAKYALAVPPVGGAEFKQALLSALEEMTFAERYEIKDLPLHFSHALEPRPKQNVGEIIYEGHARGTGYWHIWSADSRPQLDSNAFEIKNLIPAFGIELTLGSNPLELGLYFGIGFDKGCYPGQEVIEKIISLGSPARRLVQVSGTKKARVTEKLFDQTGIEAGTLTRNEGNLGLAILKKSSARLGEVLKCSDNEEVTVTEISNYENTP